MIILDMEIRNQDSPQDQQSSRTESPERIYFPYYEKAVLLYEQKKFEDAIQLLKKELPCWGKADLLGSCYAELMDFSQAEESYLEAIKLDPDQTGTLYNIAMLYYDFFQPYEAKKYYELYIRKEPNDIVGLFNYAVVLLDLDLQDEAYEVLKKAHAIDPRDVYVIINLAFVILHKKIRPRVALRLLKKAAEINPVDPNVLFSLAKVAWDVGEELTCFTTREMLQLIDPELCAELDERTGRQSWQG